MDEKLKDARDNAQESKNFASGKIVGIKAPNNAYGEEQTIDANHANPYSIVKYDRQNRKTSMADRRINYKVQRDKIKEEKERQAKLDKLKSNKRTQNESTADILDDIDYLLNS